MVGDPVAYTISVTNAGPDDAVGAVVSDVFPPELTNCSWTCVGTGGGICSAGPVAGDLSDMVDLPLGGSVTYTATCTIDPGATGTLANTATVLVPAAVIDPNSSNDSATDTDMLVGPCGFPNDLILDNQTIATTVVFQACNTIIAGPNFQILAGGNVTFRGGQQVIMSNDFSVASGATLVVEIDASLSSR